MILADITTTATGLGAFFTGLASLVTAMVGLRLSIQKGKEDARVEVIRHDETKEEAREEGRVEGRAENRGDSV